MGHVEQNIILIKETPVSFQPTLFISESDDPLDKFAKIATFETELEMTPLITREEETNSAPLFYLVSRCLESTLWKENRKVIIQIRQPMKKSENGAILHRWDPWSCYLHFDRMLVDKLNATLPDGFRLIISISDVTLSPNDHTFFEDKTKFPDIATSKTIWAGVEGYFSDEGYLSDSPPIDHVLLNDKMRTEVNIYFNVGREDSSKVALFIRGSATDHTYDGKLSLHLTIKSSHQLDRLFTNEATPDLLSRAKFMYETKLHSDLTIQCGPSGEDHVPAHRAMVAASSPILRNMLNESGIWKQDNPSGVLKLEEMTKEAVDALLAFIYFWGVDAAIGCSRVAVQLLMASNKYLMETLQERIMNLLLIKPDHWFIHLDSVLHLYMFARVSKISCTLQKKAAKILKRRYAELLLSDFYHEACGQDSNLNEEIDKIINSHEGNSKEK